MELKTRFLFEMRGVLGAPLEVGAGPEGHRQSLPVASGIVEGPEFKGEIVGPAADWARIRPDGSFALDVRLTVRASNGDLIYMTYGGRIAADDDEGLAIALDFGKADPERGSDRYYFRTNPLFETASEEFGWLNKIVAVGTGMTGAGGVTYRIFAVE